MTQTALSRGASSAWCEVPSSSATVTAGSFTTARTPGILRISASLLIATTCPVKEGAVLMAALSMPGTTTSMP